MQPRRHLFISYKREDVAQAGRIRLALKAAGFVVWWDRELQTGQKWEERIDAALASAQAIVVLWSKAATTSDWVKHEASVAKSRGVLVQIRIEDCFIPTAFQAVQAADFREWTGDDEREPNFQNLIRTLRRLRRAQWMKQTLLLICALLASIVMSGPSMLYACPATRALGIDIGCYAPPTGYDAVFELGREIAYAQAASSPTAVQASLKHAVTRAQEISFIRIDTAARLQAHADDPIGTMNSIEGVVDMIHRDLP